MASKSPPATGRTWQYRNTKGGLEANLHLNPSNPVPKPKPTQHLIQVIACALNPVDYKPAETPLFGRLIAKRPATPGNDVAGRIVTPASGSSLKPGDLVFGVTGVPSPFAGGALSEYALSPKDGLVPIPAGVSPVDAATIGVAGLTAVQSILDHTKTGDKIFINGGSGGVGVFGIQIAKAAGRHVTASCSTPNVELCKSLGADEVIDYKKGNVVDALVASGVKYDFVVDNVGATPLELLWRCHEYTKPGAAYMLVAGVPNWAFFSERMKIALLPSFLGGVKRPILGVFAKPKPEQLTQIGEWMKEGKVKPVIDTRFAFEEAPKAIAKLRTGRTRGKLVVEVAPEA